MLTLVFFMPISSIANCPECPGANCDNCVFEPSGGSGGEDGSDQGGGGGNPYGDGYVPQVSKWTFFHCEDFGYPDCNIQIIRCDYGHEGCHPNTQTFCVDECYGMGILGPGFP